MSRVTIDVIHLDVRVPLGLPEPTYESMSRVLGKRRLRRRLARLAERVLRHNPALETITVRVSR